MSNSRLTCDPKRIELFLQQQLSDTEQAAFQLHLDDCTDCRRQLEAAAAGDDIWSEVRESLRGGPLPGDSLRVTRRSIRPRAATGRRTATPRCSSCWRLRMTIGCWAVWGLMKFWE